MSTVSRPDAGSDNASTRGGFFAGRSGLVFPLILAAASTWIVIGNLRMAIPKGVSFPGPTFFPWILAISGYVLAALLVVQYLRHPEHPEPDSLVDQRGSRWTTYSDWTSIAWCVGGFLVFALTIEVLGWILAAAVLFWCTARGMGSRRALFDVSLSLVASSVVYLLFHSGLGLPLPSGLLGGW